VQIGCDGCVVAWKGRTTRPYRFPGGCGKFIRRRDSSQKKRPELLMTQAVRYLYGKGSGLTFRHEFPAGYPGNADQSNTQQQ
jgi:hypothetical protein